VASLDEARIHSFNVDAHLRLERRFWRDLIEFGFDAGIGRLESAQSGSSSLFNQSSYLIYSIVRAEIAVRVWDRMSLFAAGERRTVSSRSNPDSDITPAALVAGFKWRME
jgi:hypothetical protein